MEESFLGGKKSLIEIRVLFLCFVFPVKLYQSKISTLGVIHKV